MRENWRGIKEQKMKGDGGGEVIVGERRRIEVKWVVLGFWENILSRVIVEIVYFLVDLNSKNW